MNESASEENRTVGKTRKLYFINANDHNIMLIYSSARILFRVPIAVNCRKEDELVA